MAEDGGQREPKSRRLLRPRPAWVVIALALAGLGLLAAGFLFKAARTRDSLVLRNHRALSRIADGANLILDGEATRLASLIRDQAGRISGATTGVAAIRERIERTRASANPRDRDLYEGLAVDTGGRRSCPGQPLPISVEVRGARLCSSYTIEPDGQALRVRVLLVLVDAGDGHAARESESLELSRPIPLTRLFAEGPGSAVFDKFVAADGQGNVLFERGETVATLSNLEHVAHAAPAEADGQSPPTDLRSGSAAGKVDLGGRSYWLFTRPLRGVSSPEREGDDGSAVVLGALVSTRRLDADSRRISPTLLLHIALIGLAVFLSIPLLKLVSIGPYDRLRATDGLRVVLCTVFGAGLITIAAVDLHEYKRLRDEVDDSLERLAHQVRSRLHGELEDARNTARLYRPAPAECVEDPMRCAPGDVFWRHGWVDRPEPPDDAKIGRRELFAGVHAASVLDDFPYPYFTAMFLTDAHGTQFKKFSVRPLNTRWTSVARRAYYRELDDHPYRLRLGDDTVVDYRLEPIYSFTDGRRETILALRREDPPDPELPFVYLSIKLQSLYGVVLPDGFGFAIVDRDGVVEYHSDERRNLAENFLTECDGDRWLAAALRAASGRTGDVKYLGTAHRAHVVPIDGTPWALVTFFDKDLIRSMNVEASTLAVALFVVLMAVCLVLVGIAALSDFPRLTRRFWMDPAAIREYRIALVLLAAIDAVFLAALVHGHGHVLVWLSFAIPLSCLVGAFFLLTPRRLRGRIPRPIARALGAAILVAGLAAAIRGVVKVASNGPLSWWVVWLTAVVLVVGVGLRGRRTVFLALAASLTTAVGILPALGFFRAAFEHEAELMVRSQQIDLVRQIGVRRGAVLAFYEDDFPNGKAALADRRLGLEDQKTRARDVYTNFWLDTTVGESTRGRCEALAKLMADKERGERPPSAAEVLHEAFRFIRPYYGQTTVDNADLFVDAVPERSWSWSAMHGAETEMVDCSQRFASVDAVGPGDPEDSFGVALSSALPLRREAPPVTWWIPVAFVIVVVVGATRLMLAKLTLLYQDAPHGVAPSALFEQLLGRATIVLGAGADTVERVVSRRGFVPLELHGEWDPDTVASAVPAEATVTVKDLDELLDDRQHHARLLDSLDTLLESGRRVVLFGRRHPNDGFPWRLDSERSDHVPEPELRTRWGEVWQRFDVVTVRDRRQDDLTRHGLESPRPAPWLPQGIDIPNAVRARIVRECRHTEPLQRIGRAVARAAAIFGDVQGSDRDALERAVADDIFERAAGHYDEIWRRCTKSERRVLHQIATTGLVNWHNGAVLRRLVRMGLVRWDANLALFNSTFARWVAGYVDGPALYQLGTDEAPSIWRLVRIPLVVTLMIVAAVMFTTQPELFGSAVAIATAVAGSIPLVLRLVSTLQAGGSERSS